MILDGIFLAAVVAATDAIGIYASTSSLCIVLWPCLVGLAGLSLNALRGVVADTAGRFPRWRSAWVDPSYHPPRLAHLVLTPQDYDLALQALIATIVTVILIAHAS